MAILSDNTFFNMQTPYNLVLQPSVKLT